MKGDTWKCSDNTATELTRLSLPEWTRKEKFSK